MTDLRWAPPRREDDEAWAELLAAIEAVDVRGETYELEDIDTEWRSVWAEPEHNARLVWDGPQLVAFAWLTVRPGSRAAHKVNMWGGVRPSHRRRGIGTQLFQWAIARAKDVATAMPAGLPTKLEADAASHQTDLLLLAERMGLQAVRHFYEIARPASAPLLEAPAPPGLELVPWTAERDEEARLAHVEAFADHWGSEPRTREEWTQWYTGHRGFRPDLSVLAVDPASGRVEGLVLCAAYPQDWVTVPVEAWLTTVGTRRDWRGKGVASWLITDALRRIAAADDGFERAILGVDSENPTGALRVYRRLGFSDDVRSVTSLNLTIS
ncbi:MAG: GNAT family N-acetyltransferase [Acidimicrobiales bacterium]